MRFEDQGIILGLHPLGESKKIVTVLTHDHGRHKGVWRPRKNLHLQPAALVTCVWHSRLVEQLGTWTFDMNLQTVAYFIQNPMLLLAAHSAVSLCDILLPEREPVPKVYKALYDFIIQRSLKAYCFFELSLLNDIHFPLDLKRCALGGELIPPVYVSPKTGKAVSGERAGAYIPRLLPVPVFMHTECDPLLPDVLAALHLTGYFLERYRLDHDNKPLPLVRQRFITHLKKIHERTPHD